MRQFILIRKGNLEEIVDNRNIPFLLRQIRFSEIVSEVWKVSRHGWGIVLDKI